MKFDDDGHAVGFVNVHDPSKCDGRLCDFHGRRGEEPWASWDRAWRSDWGGFVEMIDPNTGIGHPSPAQARYWFNTYEPGTFFALMTHGCDGACEGAYDDIWGGHGD